MRTETLESFMPHFTEFSPNSYTYSKSLAEQICSEYQNRLPIIIVRPSIVTGTGKIITSIILPTLLIFHINECRKRTFRWMVSKLYMISLQFKISNHPKRCDNFNGPVGLLTACGIGIMRTIRAPYETVLDSIAVDVVAKTLIVAAWKKAMDDEIVIIDDEQRDNKVKEISNEMTVYNCATLHSMTLGKIVYCGQFLVRTWPFEKTLWLPGGGVTMCPYMNYFRVSC